MRSTLAVVVALRPPFGTQEGSQPPPQSLIRHGDRIAQLVLSSIGRATITEVAAVDATDRGGGGFGSTGRR